MVKKSEKHCACVPIRHLLNCSECVIEIAPWSLIVHKIRQKIRLKLKLQSKLQI